MQTPVSYSLSCQMVWKKNNKFTVKETDLKLNQYGSKIRDGA